ncbi:hypothetical protein RF11_13434 [Thelohanellus kitauei]|uniref:Uncharacterized protein n=1 Tax=Thelohanellus kitauei TaxID=669202 RepID=A0A0C2M7T1_THEKT|nr:hypothetical protein RF11_13434 [Thelohanellus kitauei]
MSFQSSVDYSFTEEDMREELSELSPYRIYVDFHNQAQQTLKIELILQKEAGQSIMNRVWVEVWSENNKEKYFRTKLVTDEVIPHNQKIEFHNKIFNLKGITNANDVVIVTVKSFAMTWGKMGEVGKP